VKDGPNLDGELLLASSALEPTLLGQPDAIAHFAATDAENYTVGPTHELHFVDANQLIAEVFNRVYESGRIAHR
jgi:hypothetical protein